jgi:hypothetical protein
VSLMLVLATTGCAYLPRTPVCLGAITYRGYSQKDVKKLPPELRRDVESRSGVTFETWYQSKTRAVVIAVSRGSSDHAYSYLRNGAEYHFESDEDVPCLIE